MTDPVIKVKGPRSAERAGVKWNPNESAAVGVVTQMRLGHEVVVELIMLQALAASIELVEKAREGEVYPGIKKALNTRMQVVLQRYDDFTAQRLARFVVTAGDKALGAVSDAPNEQTRCLACAYAACAMIDLHLVDPESTVAAVALGMCEESDTDRDPAWNMVKNPKSWAKIIAEKVRIIAATY